ncbi:RagB/SusD family nutrient uptake outer membrane protein [Pseudoflavitalea sp. X16]|uniref:RagB/SusD family nutrient uptake outer membrane protein n=1 Tax=Paraflavitalea devenefica TaxID=2716334 RepID=UPI00141EAD12|nr:RagB/SusD family nutrient uptake outer membrane protein [Paraflavitalea devenefica]NII29504.1 RagB/SusD family nutrient uptake outer membrane protein [Paraflavitalea devenefica]
MILNKKMNVLVAVAGCMLSLLLTGCTKINEYLDKAESGGLTEDQVFGDYVQTQAYLASIYYNGINAGDWMPAYSFTYAAASDEAKCPYTTVNSPVGFNNGSISPTYNPIDIWGGKYQHIRQVNRLIAKIDQVPVSDDPAQISGRSRMKGEGYFLRAFFYFQLFQRYGGVPIIDRVLTIDDKLNLPRNSADEVVAFIVKDCDSAANYLATSWPAVDLGRATKGAALLLKARTLLYAASLLHNPENKTAKWVAAAAAAKVVMDMKDVYKLDDNYKTLFHTRTSKEIIFQSSINQVWQVVSNDWVRHTEPPGRGGGWGNLQPLQNIVDDYEMANGKYITDPTSGYDPNNPYVGRDPRFHQSIIYNGRTWLGVSINTYVGAGADGLNNSTAATQTGYYVAKNLDENATLISSYKPGSHYWIFMRYTEAFLDYAEAQNEAVGPDQSVYDAINLIRDRTNVKMPPLPVGLSKDEMRERIRHERRIELAFEAHRFWDVRRWRIGGQATSTDAYGMKITKTGSTFKYEKFLLEKRVYKPAFDLFPIPQTEREKQPALSQNLGYN